MLNIARRYRSQGLVFGIFDAMWTCHDQPSVMPDQLKTIRSLPRAAPLVSRIFVCIIFFVAEWAIIPEDTIGRFARQICALQLLDCVLRIDFAHHALRCCGRNSAWHSGLDRG